MRLPLLLLPLVAPIFAAPTEEWADDAEWTDDIEWLEGPGYIVPNNITIDPFEEIDPTIPGIRLAGELAVDDAPTLDVELPTAGIEARADRITTNFFMGKSRAEYGCDQTVRPIFQKAVESLCQRGGCDEGSSYYHRVKWSNRARRANLKVDVSGFYAGNVRHRLIDAAKSTVVSKAFTSYTKRWGEQIGLGGRATRSCHMSRFPNYIQIDRRVNGLMRDQLKITVTPPEKVKQNFCMVANVLTSIAGAMNEIAGGFFGVVTASGCS